MVRRVNTRELGRRLREERETRAWSCNQLDERAGLASGSTSRLERGARKSPEWETIWKLSRALEVRVEWLAEGILPKREAGGDDPLPRRAEAARLLMEDGCPEGPIASVLARAPRPGDDARSALWWVEEMRHEARQR